MQPANVTITVEEFVKQFPEFADNPNNERMLIRAQCFISTVNYGALTDCCRTLAIYLFTAHLLTLQNSIEDGDTTGGIQASASIDKVSISMIPPPSSDQFDFWLNQTQYGAELLVLLSTRIVTPQYVGGSFIRVLR